MNWLAIAPKIRRIPDTNKCQPYPLSWDEQARLFRELPGHPSEMALFAVNTARRRKTCVKNPEADPNGGIAQAK